jgi:hypothetical protein
MRAHQSPQQIAEARALLSDSPIRFMQAYHVGLCAVADDLGTEQALRASTRGGDASSAAGLIEGLAAARAEAGGRLVIPSRWRQDHQKYPAARNGGA